MNLRLLTYSISLAIVITGISYALSDHGGEIILWPGLLGQGMFNLLLLAIPTDDDFYSLPSKSYIVFNITIYALIIFLAVILIPWVRRNWKT